MDKLMHKILDVGELSEWVGVAMAAGLVLMFFY